jgi:predicted nucleotide-binding protein
VAVRRVIPRLESLIRLVDEKTVRTPIRGQMTAVGAPSSRRVFVVHGHDEAVKQAVARTLERLGLEPIILHELPDKGRTIIEKLEASTADVGYAVVLITPDDMGGPRSAPPESYRQRARQNVLVELGVFLGKLGRSRVTVVYHPDVEMPSDYGVLFKKWDGADGAWGFELAKEINAAGIPVDLNRLL